MTKTIKTVHLAIDIQQSFLHMPYWQNDDLEIFKANEIKLINGLDKLNIPTIGIFHIEEQGPFSKASGHAVAMDFMPASINLSFEKTVHNALTESGLSEWLCKHNVRNIIISGIRSEQCCETTTRVAADFGYKLNFITEATLTFPMQHKSSGHIFTSDEIKQKTELVLQDRFAEIHTVSSILEKFHNTSIIHASE